MIGAAEGLSIDPVVTPGLGDTSYVVRYRGTGVLVDPQRDIDRFLPRLDGTELRWVLETHLHNDYVSGGLRAAETTGAELVMPAAAAPRFRHTPAFHMEDIGEGPFVIRPIHTPGHTPEHTSYLLIIVGEPIALFSGGSLLLGAAGRPDLLGGERADTLARLQYGSVRRLAALGDEVQLYPTHGGGYFCTATDAGSGMSTLGAENASNPVLAYRSEDAFVEGQLAALQPYPSYYRHMGAANLAGNRKPAPAHLPVLEVEEVDAGASVVDMRDRHRFASGHLPGSIGVELREDFAIWVGWLVGIDRQVVLVADRDQDVDEAVTQLFRIGYDRVVGVVYDIDGSSATSGFQVVSLGDVVEVVDRDIPVLDVRAPAEGEEDHLEGSVHVYLPDLPTAPLDAFEPGGEVWVVCGTGYRASAAGGILENRGFRPRVLMGAGIPDLLAVSGAWAATCDPPLVTDGRAQGGRS